MLNAGDTTGGVNETFRKRSRLGWLPGDQQEDQPHEETVSPCNGCDKADTCKNICQKLKSIIQNTNGCAEIQDKDAIVILPEKGIIYSFSSMPEGRGLEDREYGVEFNTDGLKLTLTTVFIEYFFKRRPLYDIADDLGVDFSTVHSYFTRAVERINRIVRILDTRESVLKYTGKTPTLTDIPMMKRRFCCLIYLALNGGNS